MKILGWAGMVLVQFSTLFQLWHFYQNKKTNGVSIGFWWTVYVGLMCYLAYSISIMDWVYITSNAIGITLSSISIVMYYHYRKAEENGSCNRRMDTVNDCITPGVGSTDQPAKTGGYHSGRRTVFPEVSLRRNADNRNRGGTPGEDLWKVQEKEMLGRRANLYFVNFCPYCYKIYVNFQGTEKQISMDRAEVMIFAGAKRRFYSCYMCRKEAGYAQESRGG